MKYFIDTEFKEQPNTIDIISVGIVAEDGREYYAISKDFDLKRAWKDEWIRENVLKPIHTELCHKESTYAKTYFFNLFESFTRRSLKNLIRWHGKTNKQIAQEIIQFCKGGFLGIDPKAPNMLWAGGQLITRSNPEFYGYYADYDWVVFCWLFGRMIDLPKGFPMYCKDIKQMMDDKGLTKEWKRQNCPDPEGEHNALVDARWNKKLYESIISLA